MPTADNDTQVQSTNSNESADLLEVRPQSVHIKKETLEEDLENNLQGTLRIRQERAVECDDGKSPPIADTDTEPAIDTEELSEQHSTRHSVWEDSGLGSVLKAEQEQETVDLKDAGSEHTTRRRNSLSYEYLPYERSSQQQTLFSQQNTSTEDPACFYATANDSESLHTHTELRLCPNADKGEGQTSKEFLDVKLGAVVIDSGPNELGDTVQETVYGKHRHYKESGDRPLLLENDAYSPQSQMMVKENIAVSKASAPPVIDYRIFDESFITQKGDKSLNRSGTREKRFICTFCGKSFTCPKNLETHQRVHTGEKPFSCTQCGKRFADSSNRKRHQIIHTGERPYSCTLCGKRFTQSSCLIAHQRVHTGEKPFSCTQCGKRFADSSNLKRHQSVHIGKKPLSCTLWEELNCFKAS
ncbi:zinc finger protein with KRAB and SCAN domains 7-like isoform X2 [Conger conger]|nr:zinc finger protein with KRAB and SCAN domains 7-like isoform X2 [Conger conger]